MKIDSIKPFMGKMKIEIIKDSGKESVRKQLVADGRMSADSMIELPDAQFYQDVQTGEIKSQSWGSPQIKYGKVLEMSSDCFGELFKKSYGSDRDEYPEVGDIVYFVPGTTFQINPEGLIHLLDDTKVLGFIKAKDIEAV